MWRGYIFSGRSASGVTIVGVEDAESEPAADLDGPGVAEGAVAGTVQPFGKPCKVSASVGVRRRTKRNEVFSGFGAEAAGVAAGVEGGGNHEVFSVGIVSGVAGGDGEAVGDEVIGAVASWGGVAVVTGGGGDGDGEVGVVLVSAASAVSAASKRAGKVRPRLCALRRIPLAALGLKKNLFGASFSSTCDKEHSTASLGDSEPSRVQHAPCDGLKAPQVPQASKDGGKVFSVAGRE